MADVRDKATALILKQTCLCERDAKDLERGIYNWAVGYADEHCYVKAWVNPTFMRIYHDKVRSVVANLDKDSYIGNTRLADRLAEKEFVPHDVPFLKPENVFPEVWRECVNLKMKRDEHIGVNTLQAMTDLIKCARCKQYEVAFYEMQTRGSDESLTIFCSCLNCGHHWKM